MGRSFALALGIAVTLLAPSAFATSPDEPSCGSSDDWPSWRNDWDCEDMSLAALSVYGGGSVAVLDAYELETSSGQDTPTPFADRQLWLDGRGYLAGGGMRLLLQSEGGFRFGLGTGVFHLGGVALGHDPLPEGISARADDALVANFELSFGKAFDARYFYPYIDIKGSVNVVATTIDIEAEPYGFVGNAQYQVPSFTAAPRIGAFVPLDDEFFIDLGAQYGLFGIEGLGGYAAVGIWDNL